MSKESEAARFHRKKKELPAFRFDRYGYYTLCGSINQANEGAKAGERNRRRPKGKRR